VLQRDLKATLQATQQATAEIPVFFLLQCAAVCCRALQGVAVCCSVL